ncbi:MAG TPA: PilZ domain-containing protein [Pyrinomonadaceae bacterium]|nr:PilZ domain-containing protein [Pyrinomonadaceae bacterium]
MAAPMTHEDESLSTLDLQLDQLTPDCQAETSAIQERRRKPRLSEPFPARMWGVDSGDLPFNVDCVLDNISSTGLYLRMPTQVTTGDEVRLIVHLVNGPTSGATAALNGKVLRTEVQPDGRHGLAIAITKHKFL